MKVQSARWLILLLLIASSVVRPPDGHAQPVDCAPGDPTGLLLIRPVDSIGTLQRGLLVVDPTDGSELRRIELPLVDQAFATKQPGIALAISGSELYLVDANAGAATVLPLSGAPATDLSPNPVQFRGTGGSRFMLLGSPSFDQVYLVDLIDRVATDLTALIPVPSPDTPVFLSFAALTPDDRHVIAWDGRHIYDFDTENLTVARPVDSSDFAFSPDFSSDGQELIYSTSAGPGSGSDLILESIDGTESELLRTSTSAQVTLWIPNTRTIFIDERTESGAAAGEVVILDLESGVETSVLSYTGSLTTVQLSADGTHALLGFESMTGGQWSLLDLASGEVNKVPQITGGRALPGLYSDADWALIVPIGEDSDPLTGPLYRGVNLVSGEVGRLLEQPAGMQFNQPPTVSVDGRRSLVVGASEQDQTLWLLDANDLRATELLSAPSVTAAFSPDTCQVAVTIERKVDGLSSFGVVIRSTSEPDSARDRAPVQGQLAAWVA